MTNEEKLRETFPKTIFIFQKNGNDETTAIMCSDEWLQRDYDQMYKDSAPCEQIKWERDTALAQLKELGYGLGEKIQPCEDVVSREHLLSGIDELMQSPWFNNGKDDDMFTHYGYTERKEAVEIVRDLCVKTEPPVTPKPTECENAVDRDTIIQEMEKRHKEGDAITIGYIKNLPPVTPKQRTGKWIKTPKAVMGEGYLWYCDKCGHQVYQDSSRPYPSEKYCPSCGAKMEGESE